MSPSAAQVVRIRTNASFGSLEAHAALNCYKQGRVESADSEDEALQKWWHIKHIVNLYFLTQWKKNKVYPIPGSTRWQKEGIM